MKLTRGQWAMLSVACLITTQAGADNLLLAQSKSVVLAADSQTVRKTVSPAAELAAKQQNNAKTEARDAESAPEEKPVHLINMVKINGI